MSSSSWVRGGGEICGDLVGIRESVTLYALLSVCSLGVLTPPPPFGSIVQKRQKRPPAAPPTPPHPSPSRIPHLDIPLPRVYQRGQRVLPIGRVPFDPIVIDPVRNNQMRLAVSAHGKEASVLALPRVRDVNLERRGARDARRVRSVAAAAAAPNAHGERLAEGEQGRLWHHLGLSVAVEGVQPIRRPV